METTLTDQQLLRLPRYAVQEIQRLSRDKEYWKEIALAGADESNTFRDFATNKQPLGQDPNITFYLKGGPDSGPMDRIVARVRIEYDHGGRPYLDIHTDDTILVNPRASNAIKVYCKEL